MLIRRLTSIHGYRAPEGGDGGSGGSPAAPPQQSADNGGDGGGGGSGADGGDGDDPGEKPEAKADKPAPKTDDKAPEAKPPKTDDKAPAKTDEGKPSYEELAARLAALEEQGGKHEQQMAEARKTARADALERLRVLPEYRDLVPDHDPLTEAGRAKLEAFVKSRPRLVADTPGPVAEAGLKAEDFKDKPGAMFVDLDQYAKGQAEIEAKFGGRGWL